MPKGGKATDIRFSNTTGIFEIRYTKMVDVPQYGQQESHSAENVGLNTRRLTLKQKLRAIRRNGRWVKYKPR